MTAEIAILNREAVALAADSAMSLAGPLSSKTYDSAEKIFELTRFLPIGLMIYNNALFMNMPLGVLVRRYRERLTRNEPSDLFDAWDPFERFLIDTASDEADHNDHFQMMLNEELKTLQRMVFNSLSEALVRGGRKPNPKKFLQRKIAERAAEALADRHHDNFLQDITLEQFVQAYGELISSQAKEWLASLIKIDEDLLCGLHEMVFAVIRSNHRSNAYTGFVLAGFGSNDLLPKLFSIEWDGIFFKRARKLKASPQVEIDRRTLTAAVVPFAQKDMPERFMLGIDGKWEIDLEKAAAAAIGEVIDRAGAAFKKKAAAAAKAEAIAIYRQELQRLRTKSRDAIVSVVNHMSKKELGELAHSLVEITSRKRRYSNEKETVGGPIDLAILTLNEGFVWVKRKHYFDPAINPQYPPAASTLRQLRGLK
ncbi:hypothetical protein RFN29_21705 [Mesorhizobium sp. VK22B]|uniref:Uncharacterized protein n=1 Tax=Mesorhizobium captivum TaxID=3072319 RepID=A0ABU4Z4N6_9HYPH|nr:hypothetical protein [Mesorhizobium sp. VK22B]MDX8494186.1 hypothetical protein [Mesorhizobium sp. VK22B]